jgi:hypothetical protein
LIEHQFLKRRCGCGAVSCGAVPDGVDRTGAISRRPRSDRTVFVCGTVLAQALAILAEANPGYSQQTDRLPDNYPRKEVDGMKEQDLGDATDLTQGFDFSGRYDQQTHDKYEV